MATNVQVKDGILKSVWFIQCTIFTFGLMELDDVLISQSEPIGTYYIFFLLIISRRRRLLNRRTITRFSLSNSICSSAYVLVATRKRQNYFYTHMNSLYVLFIFRNKYKKVENTYNCFDRHQTIYGIAENLDEHRNIFHFD